MPCGAVKVKGFFVQSAGGIEKKGGRRYDFAHMAIQIDDDWKKQAQAEKKKLAEREAAAKAPPAPVEPPVPAAAPAVPEASFATIVQTIMSQALYYLGEMAYEGEQPQLNLDIAHQQISMLAILDEKTRGNLTAQETSLMDQALYDLRSRYVSIARQMIV